MARLGAAVCQRHVDDQLFAMSDRPAARLGSAIYLCEYASMRSRSILKPVLEVLARCAHVFTVTRADLHDAAAALAVGQQHG